MTSFKTVSALLLELERSCPIPYLQVKSSSFKAFTRHSHRGGEIKAWLALSQIVWNGLIPRMDQCFAGVSRYTRSWSKKNDKTPFLVIPGLVCRRRFRRVMFDLLDVKSLVEHDSVC